MTFKDLARLVTDNLANRNIGYHQRTTINHISAQEQQSECFTEQFCQKQFWIWADIIKHKTLYIQTKGKCCFNNIIGLPRDNKTGEENPLFDYQQLIFESLENHKFLWILKATGLGIIEFFLRYMAWLCLKDDTYQGS